MIPENMQEFLNKIRSEIVVYIVSDLTQRYGVAEDELFGKLREMPGDFDQNVQRNELVFNDAAVKMLDKVFEYVEPVHESSDEEKREETLRRENENLRQQIDELKSAVQTEKNVSNDYQNELDALQKSLLSIQEGHDGMNSTLIKKYKASSERFEKQYKLLQEQFNQVVRENDERIREYEVRIADLEDRLQQINDLQRQGFINETKLYEASKKESKLMSELSKKNSEINLLVLDKNKAEEKCQQSVEQVEFIKSYMYEAADKLEAVVKNIRTHMESEQLPVVNIIASMAEDPTVHSPVLKDVPEKPLGLNNAVEKQEIFPDNSSVKAENDILPDSSASEPSEIIMKPEKPSGNIMFEDEPFEFNRSSEGGTLSGLKKKLSGLLSMF